MIWFFFPRLDCTFKEGPVPAERGPIPPIRLHWINFADNIVSAAHNAKINVSFIETPLWQMTKDVVLDVLNKHGNPQTDIVLFPHKTRRNFDLGNQWKVYYYMQMVFPHIFSIDSYGWCARASTYPLIVDSSTEEYQHDPFEILQNRAYDNKSKFEQPDKDIDWDDLVPSWTKMIVPRDRYNIFLCQLPHDESIQDQSSVSVLDALQATIDFSLKIQMPLIVKSHPLNKQSQSLLKQLTKKYYKSNLIRWSEDDPLGELLEKANSVFTVNSGAGFEAMLFYRPVFVFGDADYDCCAHKLTLADFDNGMNIALKKWKEKDIHIINYRKLVNQYVNMHFDTSNPQRFQDNFNRKFNRP